MAIGQYENWGKYFDAFAQACSRNVMDGAQIVADTVKAIQQEDPERKLGETYSVVASWTGKYINDRAPSGAWSLSPTDLFAQLAPEISNRPGNSAPMTEAQTLLNNQAAAVILARGILKHDALA